MQVVIDELRAATGNVTEAEIARAKAQMKAGLLMALESSSARAEQLARQMFAWGRPMPLDEIVAKIEAVTVEIRAAGRAVADRAAAARRLLRSGPAKGLRARPASRKVWCQESAHERSMAFFRAVSVSELSPAVQGDGVFLRAPQMADFADWVRVREQSRDFLTPWEPVWPADDLTRGGFKRRLKRYSEDFRGDQAYPFFLFDKGSGRLVGGLTLTNIRRGVAQAGSLGYWIGAPFARQGFMTAGVRAFVPFAFDACGCIGSRPPAFPPTRPRSDCSKKPDSSARAMRANISASTASGRTTCFMRGCRATRRINDYDAHCAMRLGTATIGMV